MPHHGRRCEETTQYHAVVYVLGKHSSLRLETSQALRKSRATGPSLLEKVLSIPISIDVDRRPYSFELHHHHPYSICDYEY